MKIYTEIELMEKHNIESVIGFLNRRLKILNGNL